MQDQGQHIDPESDDARIFQVINEMLAPFGKEVTQGIGLFGSSPPINTSKPNEHDSKAEFQKEYDIVSKSLEGIGHALAALIPDAENAVSEHDFTRFSDVMDEKLRRNATNDNLGHTRNLLRKNIAEVGGITAYLTVLLDLQYALQERSLELEDQKERFWSLSHRAPDYYARAIALRLAKLFAEQTGTKPSYGTSGETGEASTGYTRALREIFKILGITSSERSYAEWAAKQITERDLLPSHRPVVEALLGEKYRPEIESLTEIFSKRPQKKGPD